MEITEALIYSREIERLIMALICGFIIGFDRGLKRRGAGLKTHILVCIGATVVMLTSIRLMELYPDYVGDIGRLGAQVISGVGFLGVGTIIITGNKQVRGLTTAAGLWATACIGLAIGIGYFKLAVTATLMILFTIKILGIVDDYLHEHSILRDYYIEISENRGLIEILEIVTELDFKLSNIEIKRSTVSYDSTAIMLSIEGRKHTEFIRRLHELSYVLTVQNL